MFILIDVNETPRLPRHSQHLCWGRGRENERDRQTDDTAGLLNLDRKVMKVDLLTHQFCDASVARLMWCQPACHQLWWRGRWEETDQDLPIPATAAITFFLFFFPPIKFWCNNNNRNVHYYVIFWSSKLRKSLKGSLQKHRWGEFRGQMQRGGRGESGGGGGVVLQFPGGMVLNGMTEQRQGQGWLSICNCSTTSVIAILYDNAHRIYA